MKSEDLTEEEKINAWINLITKDEPYTAGFDPITKKIQDKAHNLCWQFDMTNPLDTEKLNSIQQELLPNCSKAFRISRGFKCDYGFNIHNTGFTLINYNVTILDTSPVYFGNFDLVGPGTVISCAGHGINPSERSISTSKPIHIQDNVWIGANCTINAGVTIGQGAVIASGAVVTKDIPANVIAAGVPAKVIRNLTEDEQKKLKEKM